MDYTKTFSKAIERCKQYDFELVRNSIDAAGELKCGDWDDWADNLWYRLCPKKPCGYDKCYGFLCAAYPVALLSENCPDDLKKLLDDNKVLYARLDEPMSCDEVVLQKYLPERKVFDESFMDSGDFSFDDDRFYWYNQKLDTGHQNYVNAGCFMFNEIR